MGLSAFNLTPDLSVDMVIQESVAQPPSSGEGMFTCPECHKKCPSNLRYEEPSQLLKCNQCGYTVPAEPIFGDPFNEFSDEEYGLLYEFAHRRGWTVSARETVWDEH